MVLIPMQIKMKKNEVGRAWSAMLLEQQMVPFHQFPVAFVCRPWVHSIPRAEFPFSIYTLATPVLDTP